MNGKSAEMVPVWRTGPNLGTFLGFGIAGPVRTGPSSISGPDIRLGICDSKLA